MKSTPIEESSNSSVELQMEELWDKYSEYIDDDLHSLEQVAGRNVLTVESFDNLIAEWQSKQPTDISEEEIEKMAKEKLREEGIWDMEEFYNVDTDIKIWKSGYKAALKSKQTIVFSEKIQCECANEIKTGQTSIMCCNICGKPDEEFWRKG